MMLLVDLDFMRICSESSSASKMGLAASTGNWPALRVTRQPEVLAGDRKCLPRCGVNDLQQSPSTLRIERFA